MYIKGKKFPAGMVVTKKSDRADYVARVFAGNIILSSQHEGVYFILTKCKELWDISYNYSRT